MIDKRKLGGIFLLHEPISTFDLGNFMNTPSDLLNPIIPLLCTYSTEYEAIYEPSYDPVFFYNEEDDEYEDFFEEVWDDFYPLPDSSGIGRA